MPSETIRNDLKDMVQRAEFLLGKGKLQEAVNLANQLFKFYRREPHEKQLEPLAKLFREHGLLVK